MTAALREVATAADLHEDWDALCEAPFQRRAFLRHCEAHNPCGQRTWEARRDGILVAGAMTYRLRLDLLTFLEMRSPLGMQVVGVPASVSCAGVIGGGFEVEDLLGQVVPRLGGLVVGLNLPRDPRLPGAVCGRTLPSMAMDLPFRSWEVYEGALRADYRRRLNRHAAAWSGVTSERGPCDRFDDEMHGLYLQVFERSAAKLERLAPPFFRHLPEGFHLTVHRDSDRLLAWHVAVTEGTRRWFFLGGMDYAATGERATYFNLLAAIVREAIEDGMTWLDLGQTAEVPKARLGAAAVEKRLFGWHRRAAVRWAIARGRRWLEYPGAVPVAHVFRDDL